MILRTALTADGDQAEPGEVAEVRLQRSATGVRVDIDAPFHGDPPPPSPIGSTDKLWTFEVGELFIAARTRTGWAYTELELSPHGHSLALRFIGVRTPSPLPTLPHFDAGTRIDGARWRASLELPYDLLPMGPEWHVNACAIHGASPRRYLTAHALGTPPGKPDFHRPDHFGVWAVRVRP